MAFNLTQLTNDVLTVRLLNEDGGFLESITEYGVRWVDGQSNPTLERVKRINGQMTMGELTGLVANVGVGSEVAQNSFDNIPIFNREIMIDGENTFVKVKKFYIKEESLVEGGVTYHYLWMCGSKLTGYRLPISFLNEDGTVNDHYLIGAYEGYIDTDGKLQSVPGVFPTVSTSRNNFRIAARKNDGDGTNVDSRYQITDIAEYCDLVQIPMMIEFATKNMQSIMPGFTSGQYTESHRVLMSENDVNRVIITTEQANQYRVGQSIDIGTSLGGRQIARNRVILSIFEEGEGSAIEFDGEAVSVAKDNIIYNVSWKTGSTSNTMASSGANIANDGKYSIVWRGIENPYGNIHKNIDGGKIVDHQMWVCQHPNGYDDKASSGEKYEHPFFPLSYENVANNGYVKNFGFDKRFPFAKFPTEVGAGSNTYYSDYYYQNSGDRSLFVGGGWDGGSDAGPFCWALNNALGNVNLYRGARLSKRP